MRFRRLRRDRLFRLLQAEPYAGPPTSCCGSRLVQRHKYESVVCSCRITCLIPGPMPDEVKDLIAKLTSEENQAMLLELEAAMSPVDRAARAALEAAGGG